MAAVTAMQQHGCAIVLVLLGAGGCTNTVVPPAGPAQPGAVFLLDHGRHASLVLERENGISRYSYGHWGWYVENRTGPLRASGTLFGSSDAGLGRRHLPGPADLDNVRRRVRVPIREAWRIEVSAGRSNDLGDRLDGFFSDHADSHTENPLYDLEFVRHPDPYHAGHNSNHMVARWLRELGCEVRMHGPFSMWTVIPPP
jgi:hypothetical protein